MAPSLPDTLLVDLLARMLADRTGGGLRTLPEYQADFPGHDLAVEEEWRRLQAPPTGSPASDGRRAGPYRLLRELGRGGQGAVWLAVDERLQRQVALKIVPRSPLVEDLAPRFRREAQVAGRLDHPGLCPVYDVGHDDAVAWIALRYVEGETLAARLARGPLPRDEALALIEGAARALHAAHEAGVVHRDVKPGNLMLTPAGEPVVLDFGVARPREDGPPITLTGEALGTPAYMAPELLAGRGPADARVDVWALGVTLHEALAGRRPWEAATREALVRAILQDEPVPPPGASRDLRVVLATALAKEPDRRYRTAADLAEDLRRLRAREPVLARPVGPAQRLLLWARRRPALAASLGALALVVTGALVTTLLLLASTRRALDDVSRLSDLKLAHDLLTEADALWPAVPELAPRLQDWLARARAVLAREPLHRASRERGDLPGDAAAHAWMQEQLDQLLALMPQLAAAATSVEGRLRFAGDLERLTLQEPAAAWSAAAAAVAADPRYADLALRPQRGLVPLGADPDSGLQEFAALATGAPPSRDPATRRLLLDESSAAVLVLIPGGDTLVGAEPGVDRWTGRWDGPVQAVHLDAYFLGKHELTQAQWLRQTGSNPSQYQTGCPALSKEHPLMHPAERMSWLEATRVLQQLGLQLPTEAQWEHGARAGTTTPWWTGPEPETLAGAANLCDRHASEHGGSPDWQYEMWLDDGWSVHAPIGSFRANAFGLHDTVGNVGEWCRDTWEDWSEHPPRAGDGLAVGDEPGITYRGGSFLDLAPASRASARMGTPRDEPGATLGIRVERPLDP